MASANVDAVLQYLIETPVAVHELHLVFAKIEVGAGVKLTSQEKVELLREIAGTAAAEPAITFSW
jgi:hypothetical protein